MLCFDVICLDMFGIDEADAHAMDNFTVTFPYIYNGFRPRTGGSSRQDGSLTAVITAGAIPPLMLAEITTNHQDLNGKHQQFMDGETA